MTEQCTKCHEQLTYTNYNKGPSKCYYHLTRSTWPGYIQRLIIFYVIILANPVFTSGIYTLPLYRLRGPIERQLQDTQHASQHRRHVVKRSEGSRSSELHGQPGEGYYIEMEIGTPPQVINVLVDTGSSNFAVAAAHNHDITQYFHTDNSSTYESLHTEVSVPYTQGNWLGVLGEEIITLNNLTIQVNVAFITESDNFFINGSHWQGILGLAYAEIARPNSDVEPYFDTVVRVSGIEDVFSLQLCGTVNDTSMAGSLVLGGIDNTLYSGQIDYVSIYKEWYYALVLTDVSVNGQSAGMDCKEYNFDKTILDSGTTNLRLPKKVFSQVLDMIQHNTHLANQVIPQLFWSGDELLCWPSGDTPWSAFPSIELSLAVTSNSTMTLMLSPQQYLRRVNPDPRIVSQDCHKFAISPSETGSVLGAVVLEAFYVVFDRSNKRIGFALNTCQKDPNAVHPSITGPFKYDDTNDCAYQKPIDHTSALMTVAYVMAGVCGLCLLPLFILFIYWQISRCKQDIRDDNPPDISDGLLKDDEER